MLLFHKIVGYIHIFCHIASHKNIWMATNAPPPSIKPMYSLFKQQILIFTAARSISHVVYPFLIVYNCTLHLYDTWKNT